MFIQVNFCEYICCAPFWNLTHFKTVLHHFGIPKWGTHFEMGLHHFGTPSLAPFQNSAAPFWNIYFYILKILRIIKWIMFVHKFIHIIDTTYKKHTLSGKC